MSALSESSTLYNARVAARKFFEQNDASLARNYASSLTSKKRIVSKKMRSRIVDQYSDFVSAL